MSQIFYLLEHPENWQGEIPHIRNLMELSWGLPNTPWFFEVLGSSVDTEEGSSDTEREKNVGTSSMGYQTVSWCCLKANCGQKMAADASINCKFPWVWKYRKNGMFCEKNVQLDLDTPLKCVTFTKICYVTKYMKHDETTCSNHVQTIILRVIVNLHRVCKCTSENWSKEKWIWEKHARNLIISNSYMIKVSVYCNALPTRTLHEANYSECVLSKIHVCHNGVEAPEQTQETDFLHLLGKSWKITGLLPAMPQETWPCSYVPQASTKETHALPGRPSTTILSQQQLSRVFERKLRLQLPHVFKICSETKKTQWV